MTAKARRPDDLDMRSMLPPKAVLHEMIDDWLAEDIGRLDITTEFLIPAEAKARFVISTRQDVVVCGIDVAAEVLYRHVPKCAVEVLMPDGARAKALTPSLTKIEVECDALDQVREAADAGADMILLDNMDAAVMREAVALVDGRSELEASGGITLEAIREKAHSGVDYISVGRMTQSAPAADIGLDVSLSD